MVTCGVGVVDPPELAVRDHQVGIAVVRQEWRDELLALGDAAVEQETAVGADLVRHEKVGEVAQPDGEEDAIPQRADAHASAS